MSYFNDDGDFVGDVNAYEEIICGILLDVHFALRELKSALAEPILRIEHTTNVSGPLSDEDRAGIEVCARTMRGELYRHFDATFAAIEKAQENATTVASVLHGNWGGAEFAAYEESGKVADAQKTVIELKERLAWIEAQKARRAKEHNPASPGLRANVLALTGGKCAYCDAEITSDSSDGNANFVIEHVVPKSCGGPDHFANYVPACSKCNAQKSAGHVLEFIQRRLVGARVELAEAAE